MVAAIGAGAAVASAATSVGSTLAGGSSQSSSIASGQAAALAAEQNALATDTANETPYLNTGTNALSGAADAAGLNGSAGSANALANFTASPGYQYQVQQGLSAIDNGAASTGTLRSGNTIRAEENLGSQLANQDFNQYYTRLNGLATLGQTATGALGSAEISTGQGEASTDTSGATAQANITGNEAAGVSNAVTGALGNKSVQSALSGSGTPATNPSATAITAQNGTTGVGVGAGSGGLY